MPYDFMPARAEHGGHNITMRGWLDSTGVPGQAGAFTVGDLVFRNNDGEIQQFPVDATVATLADMDSGRICGVAASPGVDPSVPTTLINPATGIAYATGDEVLFWPAGHGILFKTKNIVTAANTPVVPTGIMVGESVAMIFDNTAGILEWSLDVDTAAASGTDVMAIIHAVLDSRGRNITAADTTTGVWAVFEIKTI